MVMPLHSRAAFRAWSVRIPVVVDLDPDTILRRFHTNARHAPRSCDAEDLCIEFCVAHRPLLAKSVFARKPWPPGTRKSLLSGTETCDNGPDNQTYWPATPPADACSDTCTNTLESCGDALQNGPESCDNGTNTDPDYTPAPPPASACAPGCLLPAYCGDALQNGPETCDEAAQTATCELTCLTPTCGDGTHNPLAGEACDDANTQDGDGCSADCKSIERFVFATSAQYKGDFTPMANNPDGLTGLALADLRCQQLGGDSSYKAWLSTTAASPSTRFDTAFTGLYHLPKNGSIVAMGWKDLISGTLLHAIDSDESGTTIQGNVWTNTLTDGSKADDQDCTGWTSQAGTTTVGTSSANDMTWTNLGPGQFCSDARRLYCFQDV